MRVILLFLNLCLVGSFRNILLPKLYSLSRLKDSSTSHYENICFTGSINSSSSNNLDVNPDSYVDKKE